MIPDALAVVEMIRRAAREELLPRFTRTEHRIKPDGSVVTAADFAMQARLTEELRALAPGIPLLGEEMSESAQAALFERDVDGLWCLDPLDGTSNFAAGIPLFATALALLVERRPVLAAVYDPIRDEAFHAIAGQGAFLNGAGIDSPHIPPLGRCIAVIDPKRLGKLAGTLLIDPPYRSQRNFGSAALEWCWLAAGRCQLYLHGRQKLWDYAAGALILEEAGGQARTFDNESLIAPERPTMEPRSVIAATDPKLFELWRAWVYARLAGSSRESLARDICSPASAQEPRRD